MANSKPNEYLRKNKQGLTPKDFESDCLWCGKRITPKIRRKKMFCDIGCFNRHHWNKQHGVGIKCLICGKTYRRVGRHIFNSHGMTAREYREEMGLDVKRGILLPEDREVMAEHTRENGTIKNLESGKKFWFKKGESHNYQRSPQTIARLKKQWAWARELSPANKPGKKLSTTEGSVVYNKKKRQGGKKG